MRLPIAALLLFAFTIPVSAETCRETFVRLLTDKAEKGPVKIYVTQEIKGGPTTKNYNYQAEPGHWMTEMIEPADMMWSLVYDNAMYTSTDKGKTWTKVRTMDSSENEASTENTMAEAAKTVANESCGEEEIDGVMHQTVEADYEIPAYQTKHHQKYWVHPETGWISKAVTETSQQGFASVSTQVIEKAPDLELPTLE